MKDLKEKLLVQRFQREVHINRELIHPNIVRCLDVGTDEKGAPFLVTEYVPGGDLETMFQSERLPTATKVSHIRGVLNALEYLHARQTIHRDIKPQNILIRMDFHQLHGTASGLIPRPMVSDFGLAVSYARAGGTRLTRPGTGFGTLMYMPPEQVRDAFSVRESADLYAVGVTLYYLLTGRYTFDFPTPADVLEIRKQRPELWRKPHEALRVLMQLHRIAHPFQIILSDEPVPIQKRDPSIDSKLASVVDKAVRKNAAERFQSAVEFRAALQRAVS
jgi:serine/threonine-protein kinase